MKNYSLFCIVLLVFSSCSSTKLIESWKNPEFQAFMPKNILVIGVTPNKLSRKTYETKLTKELNSRKINALQSAIVFKKNFQDSKQTQKEIEAQINKLLANGYDAILVSLVKRVKERKAYSDNTKTDYSLRKFIAFYQVSQMAYFDETERQEYDVFEIETSLYSLKKNSKRSLVWVGNYEMVDPKNSEKAINKYIKKVLKSLEKESLISEEE